MAQQPLAPALDYIDPDQHCAVGLVVTTDHNVFGRCQCRLTCKRHSEEQKAAVPDRSRPYYELLARQPMSLGHSQAPNAPRPAPGLLTPGTSSSSTFAHTSSHTSAQTERPGLRKQVVIIDPAVHCAVSYDDGTQCARSFACDVHEASDQEAVLGRTATLAMLRRLWALNSSRQPHTSINLDVHCAVELDSTSCCAHNLDCFLHSPTQKMDVEGRSLSFMQLLQIQQSQLSRRIASSGGYGLVAAGIKTESTKVGPLRRRYRRDGMQGVALQPIANNEVPTPEESFLQPSGPNMTRLRQIMYGTNPNDPGQEILSILPAGTIRNITDVNSSIFQDGADFHFAFSSRTVGSTLTVFRNHLASASAKDSCLISAMVTA